MKVFALFSIFGVAVELIELILSRLGIHTMFLINFYRLVEFECFSYLYYQRIERRGYKDILQIMGMLYFLLWMLDVSFNPFPKEYGESINAGTNILLIAGTLFVFFNIFYNSKILISEYSLFWIGIGGIIYWTGTIIIFTMGNEILKMGLNYFDALWHINWIFTIIANICFMRSFWCKIF